MYSDYAPADHPFPVAPVLLAVGVGLLGWCAGIVCGVIWATR
jgi:hypothetical protein